jgi:endonuclease-3 related protein
MEIDVLYRQLHAHYGHRSDPETWWPITYARTDPPAFERVVTNILVTRTQWPTVRRALDALDDAGLLTATALARAELATLVAAIRPTGFATGKAEALLAVGRCVVERFGTEAEFCARVTRTQLLELPRIGPETADRILLYTCYRPDFPVDTYCFRVLAHHQVIPSLPASDREKREMAAAIKQRVEERIPATVTDRQRLHALMQLAGEDL